MRDKATDLIIKINCLAEEIWNSGGKQNTLVLTKEQKEILFTSIPPNSLSKNHRDIDIFTTYRWDDLKIVEGEVMKIEYR